MKAEPLTMTAGEFRSLAFSLYPLLDGRSKLAVAKADIVAPEEKAVFDRWIAEGHHAEMRYMENHRELRFHPQGLLENAELRSIVMWAFPYPLLKGAPVASYALGDDYHDAIRYRLLKLAEALKTRCGGEYRICIDSAPFRERYWAVKSGLGYPTLNGNVYVPGLGSGVFLAAMLTSLSIVPDIPLPEEKNPCNACGACLRACPTDALLGDGTLCSSRCLNYLTIEHRGNWTATQKDLISKADPHLFGCDRCLLACPLNNLASQDFLPEFLPRQEVMSLTLEEAANMTQQEFSQRFKGSPIKRCKLPGLKRNAEPLRADPNP